MFAIDVALYGIAIASFLVQFSLSIFKYKQGERHSTICVYIVTLGITLIMTEIMKRYAGYLRPHFYSECDLNSSTLECQGNSKDSRKSFPSGHASTSFCCMTLLTLYLLQKFGIQSRINNVHYISSDAAEQALVASRASARRQADLEEVSVFTLPPKPNLDLVSLSLKIKKSTIWIRIISVFCLSPMLVAYMVAGSRVVNNFHHPADVVGGAVLGTGIAIFVHGIWCVLVELIYLVFQSIAINSFSHLSCRYFRLSF